MRLAVWPFVSFLLVPLVTAEPSNVFLKAALAKQRYDDQLRDSSTPLAAIHSSSASNGNAFSNSTYLNEKSKPFAVNGTNFPLLDFDIGESYAGLLPISSQANETRKLFFWFFPSKNPASTDEIAIWLNGGPGCSSLSGLLLENGPFLWQDGTFRPVQNPYSFSKLTNYVWIEQPVGVGYTTGEPNLLDEIDLARQFKGFWKNFVDTFALENRKIYLVSLSPSR